MKQSISKITAVIATGTAFLGSCCAPPLLLMALGVGGAGFSGILSPFRPYMIGITFVLLGIAFYTVYGCKQTCEGEASCDAKKIRKTKIMLWIATGLALLFLVGPNVLQCALS